jgi:hypothetical protein
MKANKEQFYLYLYVILISVWSVYNVNYGLTFNKIKNIHVVLKAVDKPHNYGVLVPYSHSSTPHCKTACTNIEMKFSPKVAEYENFRIHELNIFGSKASWIQFLVIFGTNF